MRLSRATRLKKPEFARVLLLQSASELRVIGTGIKAPFGAANLGQVVTPTVERNGWSGRKVLENAWSLFVRRLKALPMSAKAARPTTSPIIGIRYSRLASTCVSPPVEVNERGNW